MECLEFRKLVGADPGNPSLEARAHRDVCASCASYLSEMQALDRTILKALQVPVEVGPRPIVEGVSQPAARRPVTPRTRWYALAASVIGGVLVGTLLFTSGPRASIARSAVEHLDHEPHALVVTQEPENARQLSRVLNRAGISLRPEVGTVSYAKTCWFRGSRVPHFVVQSDGGPVTVLVLRNETVPLPVDFTELGHAGTIVPSGPGSIAIIGDAETNLEQITQRIKDAVIWSQP